MNKVLLNNLTDEELLNNLDSLKGKSPIIDILLERLEEHTKKYSTLSNDKVECPVCQCSLKVECDEDNGLYNLKVSND